jgi:uncharacterized protein YmfQ (DUF2313 family)
MGNATVKQNYVDFLQKHFPRGFAWFQSRPSIIDALVNSIAEEPCRIEERGHKFLDEMDPNTTFEMLENWERLLNIPDECSPPGDPSIFERRVRVLQKLTTGGGQNDGFYRLIAQQLGYDIDVLDVENFRDFRVGISRVGEALTNSTLPNGTTGPAGWAFAFRIKAPIEDFVRYFRVGQSTVGERLVLVENTTLECVIEKYKPAHTTVLFSYE